MENDFDVFSISTQDFKTFCNDEVDKVFSLAHEKNNWFVQKYFDEHPDIGWIMIAHKKGNIIEQGLLSGTVPTSEEIENKSREIGKMVFVYTKPKEIKIYSKY